MPFLNRKAECQGTCLVHRSSILDLIERVIKFDSTFVSGIFGRQKKHSICSVNKFPRAKKTAEDLLKKTKINQRNA